MPSRHLARTAAVWAAVVMGVAFVAGRASADELERAIKVFYESQPAAAAPLLDVITQDQSQPPSVRALAGVYLGLARASVHDRAGAKDAFRAAFKLSPTMPLPPGAAKDVVAMSEEARSEAVTALKSPAPVAPAPAPVAASPAPAPVAASPAPAPVAASPAPAPVAASPAPAPVAASPAPAPVAASPAPAPVAASPAPVAPVPPAAPVSPEPQVLAPPPPPPLPDQPPPPPDQAQPKRKGEKPRHEVTANAGDPKKSVSLGAGMRLYGVPADRRIGPALDILIGDDRVTSRFLAKFGVLFGTSNAYSVGARFDFGSAPKPFGFGAGLDIDLVYAPGATEDGAKLLIDGMVNVFNVAYEWKNLLVEVRVFSLGAYLRPSTTPVTVRLVVEGGFSIHWLPSSH